MAHPCDDSINVGLVDMDWGDTKAEACGRLRLGRLGRDYDIDVGLIGVGVNSERHCKDGGVE